MERNHGAFGLRIGDGLPVFRIRPTLCNAVMYAAAMWEFQRIHYDEHWARDAEGLPGAVVQGPVLGNYLVQAVQRWIGPTGTLRRIDWRNQGLVLFGDDLRCEGAIVAMSGSSSLEVQCTLSMRNQRDEEVMSAKATVELPAEWRP